MSLRNNVDQQRINLFLKLLGKEFRHPGRVYLVGGTSLVFEGYREQSLDIDLAFDIEADYHTDFVRAVQTLKTKLNINIEQASPADFIPLPTGYKNRCEYINRYGQLEVFHFDLYSTALSKISRGTQNDFNDVLILLQNKRLLWDKLETYFEEIWPQFGISSLKQNPTDFKHKFSLLKQKWHDPS